MLDVSQYRAEIELLSESYSGSIDPREGGKPLEPHMLLAFMLAHALNRTDKINRRCRRIERKVNHILCHLCPNDFDLDDLNTESDDDD